MGAFGRSWLRGAGLAAALLVGACGQKAEPLPVLPIGGDFALTGHDGRPFEMASLRGRVAVVFFGYSFCPDFCPTTLSKLASVAGRLEKDGAGFKTLYISVDPERDTPQVLKDDLANFKLDALGLTGTKAEIDKVVTLFGARYEIVPTPQSAGKYTVSHTTSLYLVDARGRVRIELPYEASVDDVVKGIKSVLAAGA
jgi:protein SCO1/2